MEVKRDSVRVILTRLFAIQVEMFCGQEHYCLDKLSLATAVLWVSVTHVHTVTCTFVDMHDRAPGSELLIRLIIVHRCPGVLTNWLPLLLIG